MKMKLFTLIMLLFASLSQTKAETLKPAKYVAPAVTTDLSLHLVTNVRRDATPYTPAINSYVRLKAWSDVQWYWMQRSGDTYIPVFGYSPYAACDGEVFKVIGYYNDPNANEVDGYVHYVSLSVVLSGTTYYIYWPAYRNISSGGITNYSNFMEQP